jgi:hypothetical protein
MKLIKKIYRNKYLIVRMKKILKKYKWMKFKMSTNQLQL